MATQKRIDAIVKHLNGTHLELNSVLTEYEKSDTTILERINQYIFQCELCGCWDDAGAQDENQNCEQCSEIKDDEE